jgi:hypothetical protein
MIVATPPWTLAAAREGKGGGPGSSEDDPPGPNPTPETVVTDGV